MNLTALTKGFCECAGGSLCVPPASSQLHPCWLVTQSCPTVCDPMDCSPPGSSVHGILQARRLEWVALPFSRGSAQPRDGTQGLPHCRQILYQLSHKGSPRILEWVAYPFSRGSSIPSNPTRVFSNAGGFFTNCAIKEAIYDRLFSELCFHIAA